MTRNSAILAFTAGYTGTLLLATAVSYLVFRPFGVGYIGAELMAGYLAWSTAYRWEAVNAHLALMLQEAEL